MPSLTVLSISYAVVMIILWAITYFWKLRD